MGGKTVHDAQCSKSHESTKSVDLILDIESFEQQCVTLKVLFHSYRLKQHMVNIGIDQSLSNSAIYKHRCSENIMKLYTSDGKYDNQQQYKAIIDA